MNVRATIVPWALPREEIPLGLEWSEEIGFDKIQVNLPDDMQIVELLNADKFELNPSSATIYSIKHAKDAPNYFGVVVSSNVIYDSLKVVRPIEISFIKEEKEVFHQGLEARIFRPKIELLSHPEKINLGKEKQTLPLTLRYVGFGDVNILIQGEIRGRIVTRGKAFFSEILGRLIDYLVKEDKEGREEIEAIAGQVEEQAIVSEQGRRKLSINPEFIKLVSEQMVELLENPPKELEGLIKDLKEKLSAGRYREEVNRLIQDRIQDIVLSMLGDALDVRPADNVNLPRGEPTIQAALEAPVETFQLTIKYQDALRNEYPEIKVPISFESNANSSKNVFIDIPIQVERWEEKPFLNVKEMKIG